MTSRKRNSGFTLVEILIVVIILGILAAIVIPQFTEASTDAKNSSLDSNLQALRSQFELYKVQHNDQYPWQNADGSVDITVIEARLTSVTNALHQTGQGDSIFGPYMQVVPTNPFLPNTTAVFATAKAAGVDWMIDTTLGSLVDGRP